MLSGSIEEDKKGGKFYDDDKQRTNLGIKVNLAYS